jgi:two-component system, response regulator YesN
MYKALIVDDEIIVRNAIKTIIPWDKCGLELVGTASNGKAAIEKINSLHPDIIITDIKMPVMDGIEMIHYLMETNYDGEILVLSNYDDFELVREALKNGVHDYVLKLTVKSEDFENILFDMINKLNNKNKKVTVDHFKNFEQRRIDLLRSLYITPENNTEILTELSRLSPNSQGVNYVQFAFFITPLVTNDGQSNDRLKSLLDDICLEICSGSDWFSIIEVFSTTLMVVVSYKNTIKEELPEVLAKRVYNLLFMYYNLEVCIIFTNKTKKYNELASEIAICKGLLTLFFYQYNQGFFLSSREKLVKENAELKEMVDVMLKLSWDKVRLEADTFLLEWFRELINKAKKAYVDPVYLKRMIRRVVWDLEKKMIVNENHLSDNYLNDLINEDTLLTCEEEKELLDLLTGFNERINVSKTEFNHIKRKEVLSVIKYIDRNLTNKITLSDISKHVNLSETYLSKVFKSEMGKSIITYVNERKMKKAYELLSKGELLVKEAALEVGIDDPFYFNRLFKREFGLSPKKIFEKSIR